MLYYYLILIWFFAQDRFDLCVMKIEDEEWRKEESQHNRQKNKNEYKWVTKKVLVTDMNSS